MQYLTFLTSILRALIYYDETQLRAFPHIFTLFEPIRLTAGENFFPDPLSFSITLAAWRSPNRTSLCQIELFLLLSQGANFSPISHPPRVLIMIVDSRVSFYFLFPRPAEITPQTRNRRLAKILELSAIVLQLYYFIFLKTEGPSRDTCDYVPGSSVVIQGAQVSGFGNRWYIGRRRKNETSKRLMMMTAR